MNKSDFIDLMGFPREWVHWGMYPDELFEWQLARHEPEHALSPEHDRNGAFHWWLRRLRKKEDLMCLIRLSYLDSDQFLGEDVRSHIRASAFYDAQCEALDFQLSKRGKGRV